MKTYSKATLAEVLPVHVVISKDKQLLQNKHKLNDKTFLKTIECHRFFAQIQMGCHMQEDVARTSLVYLLSSPDLQNI